MNIRDLVAYDSNEVANNPDLAKELVGVYELMGVKLCGACPGKLKTAHQELKIKFNQNTITMSDDTSKRKYVLKEKYAHIRAFGNSKSYTNETITDAVAEAMIKANPACKKFFVGFEEEPVIPPTDQDIASQLGIGEAGTSDKLEQDDEGPVTKEELLLAFEKLNFEDKVSFTSKGLPTTEVLGEITGKPVPAKLRNEAWAEYVG